MLARPHSALLFALAAGSALIAADVAEAGCTLYQHRDYGGASYYLRDGETMVMARGAGMCSTSTPQCTAGGKCRSTTKCDIEDPSWNDQLSSFKVSAGCTMRLWQHVNQGGAKFVRSNSVKYVGSAWNDQASEAWCDCR